MGRRDTIHFAVIEALEKDGWTITKDPFVIWVDGGDRRIEIDLKAEKVLVVQKGSTKIAIEIKSFLGTALLHQFNAALGQYLSYRDILREGKHIELLYLAIEDKIYQDMQLSPFIMRQIKRYDLKIIVINRTQQTVTVWIK